MNEEIFEIKLTLNELNIILGYLGKQSYETVYELIDNLQKQAQAQVRDKMGTKSKNE